MRFYSGAGSRSLSGFDVPCSNPVDYRAGSYHFFFEFLKCCWWFTQFANLTDLCLLLVIISNSNLPVVKRQVTLLLILAVQITRQLFILQSPGCVTGSVSIFRSFYKYKQLFEVNHLDRALVSNPCSLAPVSWMSCVVYNCRRKINIPCYQKDAWSSSRTKLGATV